MYWITKKYIFLNALPEGMIVLTLLELQNDFR